MLKEEDVLSKCKANSIEEVKNLTDREKYNIKEYDNMRKSLNYMQKENFPYVGFVLGGWKEIHEESFLQDIQLINHDKNECILCLEKTNKKNKKIKEKHKDDLAEELWKSQKKIKYDVLYVLNCK